MNMMKGAVLALMMTIPTVHAAPGSVDISAYMRDMQTTIRGKLPDWDSYQGKTCEVRVILTRDAMLMGASTEGGDPTFCAAMLKALQTVKFPKFPNDDVYDVFKNAVIDFKP